MTRHARRAVQAMLEQGMLEGPPWSPLANVWARAARRRLVKSLSWPRQVRAVGVAGATLGGSYKTPLAIALADQLAHAKREVFLVGHGYRAHAQRARIVTPTDDVRVVGDEALVCARALQGRARVVVAPVRQQAIDLAVREGADTLVLDGIHANTPSLDRAILAVDADTPWGAGTPPPCGDLRAARADLERLADVVVPVSFALEGARPASGGPTLSVEALRGMRVGLATSVARPNRVVRMLARAGIVPAVVEVGPDHAPPHFPARGLDAWLITPKCAAWLDAESHRGTQPTAPVLVLDARLEVDMSRILTELWPSHSIAEV